MTYSNYQKGMFYEIFIKKLYAMSNSNVPISLHASVLQNLLNEEDGIGLSFLHKKINLFDTARLYLQKALDKGVNCKKITASERLQLQQLKIKLDRAASGDDLYEIVEEGLDIE